MADAEARDRLLIDEKPLLIDEKSRRSRVALSLDERSIYHASMGTIFARVCRLGMRAPWAFGVIVIACGSPARPTAIAAPRFEISAPASLDCEHPSERACIAPTTLTVDNSLGAATLRLVRASRQDLAGPIEWSFDAKPLPLGRTSVVLPTGLSAGHWSIELVASDASGGELKRTIAIDVHDRKREAARAACDACHGTWGTYGMLQSEGCDCPTTDAGKICHDVSDCQGECLDPEREPIDATTYRFVGRCSPRTMNFGCLSRVRPGTHPQNERAHVMQICVD